MEKFRDVIARQWQDGVNLLLGLWLIASPWVLRYAAAQTEGGSPVAGADYATWNAIVLGVIVAVAAASALVAFHEWEEWVSLAFPAWLIVSPWILGFASVASATWNQVVVGALVGALAIWSAWQGRRREKTAT